MYSNDAFLAKIDTDGKWLWAHLGWSSTDFDSDGDLDLDGIMERTPSISLKIGPVTLLVGSVNIESPHADFKWWTSG